MQWSMAHDPATVHHTLAKGMQGDNGVTPPSSAEYKADLVRQFASVGGKDDGGLIAQLTSNPFFTAVCQLIENRGPYARRSSLTD